MIASVRNAAACESAMIADLRAVVDSVGQWVPAGVPIRLAWVKAHFGVAGNEAADEMAKLGCVRGDAPVVTEGGVRALWKRMRAEERSVVGCSMGRVARWERRAVSRYAQLRTNQGDLWVWRERLGRGGGLCRLCGSATQTGPHLVFDCRMGVPRRGWCWGGWGELDDRVLWQYEYEEGSQVRFDDRVEDFFTCLDRELCSVVMNQPQNPIGHSSPAPGINHDSNDPPSYVYIELFLPLYLLPVLLQLIQYLTLVFM